MTLLMSAQREQNQRSYAIKETQKHAIKYGRTTEPTKKQAA